MTHKQELCDSLMHRAITAPRLRQRNDIRRVLDDGIGLLIRHLVDLKIYCNSIASIALLPDELLSQIFLQYMLLTGPWSGKWTRILSTCRRWRAVALGDVRLWSYVTNGRERRGAIKRMLEWGRRSKDHPLSCKFDMTEDSYMPLLMQNIHRTRSLSVKGRASHLRRFFEDVAELTILENLELTGSTYIPPQVVGSPEASDFRSLECTEFRRPWRLSPSPLTSIKWCRIVSIEQEDRESSLMIDGTALSSVFWFLNSSSSRLGRVRISITRDEFPTPRVIVE